MGEGEGVAAGPLLSVIIPTLNEATALPLLLGDLGKQEGVALEVVVGDGGSSDSTEAAAWEAGARFVPGPRGRGAQMNGAAGRARGVYLLFVHADSRLDDPRLLATAMTALQRAEQGQPWTAGHFRLRFQRSDRRHDLAYRYLEAKTGLDRPGGTNGDQGLLLSRLFFDRLGGFDETLPFLEDQRMAERIRSRGRLCTLPGVLATSARRFESEGFHRRYLLMGVMMAMYTLGEWPFFHRAPMVYRVQEETGRLLLTPIFVLLWSMVLRDWGLTGTLRRFYRLGRYLRENIWQVFFFADVWRGGGADGEALPLLSWHDRIVARWVRFRLVDALAGLLCFGWYMLVLSGFFGLQERLAQQMRWWRGQR